MGTFQWNQSIIVIPLRNDLQKEFPLKDFDFQNKMKDNHGTKMDQGHEKLPVVINVWTPTGERSGEQGLMELGGTGKLYLFYKLSSVEFSYLFWKCLCKSSIM